MSAAHRVTSIALVLLAPPLTASAQVGDPVCDPAECLEEGRQYDPDPEAAGLPIVVGPVYACSSTVAVTGVSVGATLTVEVGPGAIASVVTSPLELSTQSAVFVDLGAALGRPLQVGDTIRAQQDMGGGPSPWTAPLPVEAYTESLPPPVLEPLPYHDCGRAVAGRGHVPGATVTVEESTDGVSWTVLWKYDVPWTSWNHAFASPTTIEGRLVRATQTLCDVDSSPSTAEEVRPPVPEPLPAPPVLGGAGVVHVGQPNAPLHGVHFGAHVIWSVNSVDALDYGNVHAFDAAGLHALPSFSDGDTVEVRQELCGAVEGDRVEVQLTTDCDALPVAQMQPPSVGDTEVTLDTFVPGATVRVFAGGPGSSEQLGVRVGAGRRIALSRPLEAGEIIATTQQLGGCVSRFAHTLVVLCKGIQRHRNPLGVGPYAVGQADYILPSMVDLGGGTLSRVAARVHYPVDPADPGGAVLPYGPPRPVVLVMHGNLENYRDTNGVLRCAHPPSAIPTPNMGVFDNHHLGFVALLDALARAGFIAVAIDASDITCAGPVLREAGGRLFLHHLRHLADLHAGPGSPDPFLGALAGRLDLARTALISHSRGAGMLARVPSLNDDPMAAYHVPGAAFPTAVLLAPIEPQLAPSADAVPGSLLVLAGSADACTTQFRAHRWLDHRIAVGTTSEVVLRGAIHEGWADWPVHGSQHVPMAGNEPSMVLEDQRDLGAVLVRRWLEWQIAGEAQHRPLFTGDGHLRGAFDRSIADGCVGCSLAHSFYDAGAELLLDDFQNGDASLGPSPTYLGQAVSWIGFDSDFFERHFFSSTDLWQRPEASGNFEMGHDAQILEALQMLGVTDDSFTQTFPVPLDTSGYVYLHFRAGRRRTSSGDVELLVALDGGASQSESTDDVTPLLGQPHGADDLLRGTSMESVRVPLTCLAAANSEVDLTQVSTIHVATPSTGGFIFDDLSLQR